MTPLPASHAGADVAPCPCLQIGDQVFLFSLQLLIVIWRMLWTNSGYGCQIIFPHHRLEVVAQLALLTQVLMHVVEWSQWHAWTLHRKLQRQDAEWRTQRSQRLFHRQIPQTCTLCQLVVLLELLHLSFSGGVPRLSQTFPSLRMPKKSFGVSGLRGGLHPTWSTNF